jgi:hypothetical protein
MWQQQHVRVWKGAEGSRGGHLGDCPSPLAQAKIQVKFQPRKLTCRKKRSPGRRTPPWPRHPPSSESC